MNAKMTRLQKSARICRIKRIHELDETMLAVMLATLREVKIEIRSFAGHGRAPHSFGVGSTAASVREKIGIALGKTRLRAARRRAVF
jgi:hypothetical protein